MQKFLWAFWFCASYMSECHVARVGFMRSRYCWETQMFGCGKSKIGPWAQATTVRRLQRQLVTFAQMTIWAKVLEECCSAASSWHVSSHESLSNLLCVCGSFKHRYVACFCLCPHGIFLGFNVCYSSLECLLDCANGASQFNLYGRVIEGEVERKSGKTFVSEPQFTSSIRLRCEESPYQDAYRCSRMYSKCIHCEDVQWPG